MYILLIGYLYVIGMLAVASGSVPLGLFFVLVLGVLPTWLILWLKRAGQIKRAARQAEPAAEATGPAADEAAADQEREST
jgi:Flp pilus assembly protein TadB